MFRETSHFLTPSSRVFDQQFLGHPLDEARDKGIRSAKEVHPVTRYFVPRSNFALINNSR